MPTSTPVEPPLEPVGLERLGLTTGLTVADFGAGGSANWAFKISQLVGPDGQVVLFDVRKGALAAALNYARMKNAVNCRGVWSNLEIYNGAQGVGDASLDAGVMVNLLNETKHPQDVLAEIGRMLKSGARLLVIDWAVDTTHRLAPPPPRRMAAEYIAKLAQEVGFVLTETFSPSPNYWGLILVKS